MVSDTMSHSTNDWYGSTQCSVILAVLYFGFGEALYELQESDGLVNDTVYIVKENFASVQTNDNITVSLDIVGGSATSGTL